MHIIRAPRDCVPCFSQESMDKDMRVGAVSIKQWDGAHLVRGLMSNQIPGRPTTGGVPTRLSRVDMYPN